MLMSVVRLSIDVIKKWIIVITCRVLYVGRSKGLLQIVV